MFEVYFEKAANEVVGKLDSGVIDVDPFELYSLQFACALFQEALHDAEVMSAEIILLLNTDVNPASLVNQYIRCLHFGTRACKGIFRYATAILEVHLASIERVVCMVQSMVAPRTVALCMGRHTRLGHESLLQSLSQELMEMILFDNTGA